MSLFSRLRGSHKGPDLLNPENLERWQRVEMALDRVRPMLQADGGNIELIGVENGSITVKLVGACSHCPSSTYTMREGVERVLREEVPGLQEIILI